MFLNDVHVEQNTSRWYVGRASDSEQDRESCIDADDYQTLLNTADAARDSLAWGEHDYDPVEEDAV